MTRRGDRNGKAYRITLGAPFDHDSITTRPLQVGRILERGSRGKASSDSDSSSSKAESLPPGRYEQPRCFRARNSPRLRRKESRRPRPVALQSGLGGTSAVGGANEQVLTPRPKHRELLASSIVRSSRWLTCLCLAIAFGTFGRAFGILDKPAPSIMCAAT